jgi:hypothetical protein
MSKAGDSISSAAPPLEISERERIRPVSFPVTAHRSAKPGGSRRFTAGRLSRQTRIRLGAGAASAALAAAVLTLPGPAGASTSVAAAPVAARAYGAQTLALQAMPAGRVTFGRDRHHHLTVRTVMFGLTPGSSHNVDLWVPGRSRVIRFGPLSANSAGQAASILSSSFTGRWRPGSRLLISMGVGGSRVAREPIAETRRLHHAGRHARHLISVEVSRNGVRYGTPRGGATLAYNPSRDTLTVTVHARDVTPGRHAAHIHLGSCMSQGPVKYMLRDLVANRRGRIVHAVRVFTNVTTPIPPHSWYLNIHQGNSGDILSNGQPTIFFRPLLCADIKR